LDCLGSGSAADDSNDGDDNEQTVRKRLSAYHQQTAPLADWYAQRGLLVRIDGDRSIDEVGMAIEEALSGAL